MKRHHAEVIPGRYSDGTYAPYAPEDRVMSR